MDVFGGLSLSFNILAADTDFSALFCMLVFSLCLQTLLLILPFLFISLTPRAVTQELLGFSCFPLSRSPGNPFSPPPAVRRVPALFSWGCTKASLKGGWLSRKKEGKGEKNVSKGGRQAEEGGLGFQCSMLPAFTFPETKGCAVSLKWGSGQNQEEGRSRSLRLGGRV